MKEYRVKEVKKSKKGLLVSINGEEFYLSENSASELLLYPNKTLTYQEYLQLKQLSGYGDLLEKSINKLSRNPSSEFDFYQYLKQKGIEGKTIGQIIKKLKEYHLIDDESYAKAYQERYSLYLGYGQNRIKADLRRKGIDEAIINQLSFPKSQEKENAEAYLEKMKPSLARFSNRERIRKANVFLLSHGFENDIIALVLDHFDEHDEAKEAELLEAELQKSLKHYSRNYEGYELRKRVISHLIHKGYNLEEIKKKIDIELEDTYEHD